MRTSFSVASFKIRINLFISEYFILDGLPRAGANTFCNRQS